MLTGLDALVVTVLMDTFSELIPATPSFADYPFLLCLYSVVHRFLLLKPTLLGQFRSYFFTHSPQLLHCCHRAHLDPSSLSSGRSRAPLAVLIAKDVSNINSTSMTDPVEVEALSELVHLHALEFVAVMATIDASDMSLEARYLLNELSRSLEQDEDEMIMASARVLIHIIRNRFTKASSELMRLQAPAMLTRGIVVQQSCNAAGVHFLYM